MANKKISELTPVLNADLGVASVFPVVDSSDSETKKISIQQLDLRYGGTGFIPSVHDIVNGQSATLLEDEEFDGASVVGGIFEYLIIRGTTVLSLGKFGIGYLDGSWEIIPFPYSGSDHGVTFSLDQTGTVMKLKAAANSGAGNGKIYFKKTLFSVDS